MARIRRFVSVFDRSVWHSLVSAFALVLTVVTAACTLAKRRVRDVPFCPVFGRGRIGSDWGTRTNVAGDPVLGELEDFSVYDRPGFDSSAVHPEIRRFYERTSEFDLAYRTHWHRGFRVGAWLASFGTSRLEQLNLPGRSDGQVRELESEISTVTSTADPRGSRLWVRTDPNTGETVFVALYATHERDGVTYANVAVPLPGSNLSTVLRPERLEADSSAGSGVRFTTRDAGDGGLYLVTPLGGFRLPMEQSFRVWPAGSADSPQPGDGETTPLAPGRDADSNENRDTNTNADREMDTNVNRDTDTNTNPTLLATHEMWLFGRQFLTIRYELECTGR